MLVFGCDVATPMDRALHHVAPNVSAGELAARVATLTESARLAIARAASYAA